jgi:sugar lactone lactonase YvrE
MSLALEPFLDGLAFPETPRWRGGRLWFSDMDDNQVMVADFDGPGSGKAEIVVAVPTRPSGLGWLPDGTLLVVSMHDRVVHRVDNGRLGLHADLSQLAGFHCNDMCVDAHGRAYVGNFAWDPRGAGPEKWTPLILVQPDGSASLTGEDCHFPNGIVITADGTELVVAESRGRRLSKFDIAADGTLSNKRLFADLGGSFPDGICIDAEGAVWATCIFEDEVVRVEEGGRITHRVSTAPYHAYACMLGGADRRTLFVCSASTSEPGDAAKLREGRIRTVTVDVPGAGWP